MTLRDVCPWALRSCDERRMWVLHLVLPNQRMEERQCRCSDSDSLKHEVEVKRESRAQKCEGGLHLESGVDRAEDNL